VRRGAFLVTAIAAALLAGAASASSVSTAERNGPGSSGAPGLALLSSKIVTCALEGPQVVDNGVLLVKDGLIEAVGPARTTPIPDGYVVKDVGDRWLLPGAIELHCHVAGMSLFQLNDLNDMVYLTNPGLRVSPSVRLSVEDMQTAIAGGVTTVLYIPGSGTNIGGQGVMLKTGTERFEESILREPGEPGSLKLAQWGNPESWAMGVSMSFENWNTRNTFRRGVAYAKRWEAHARGEAAEPEYDIQWEVFRDLRDEEIAVSTHTQVYQVVLMTITMIRGEFGLPVFLDHSTIGGWLAGELAGKMGVPAICGPRSIEPRSRGMINWAHHGYEGVRGVAAGYQERGMDMVGFNTDSPIIPQEQLPLQAGMGARYGFDDSANQAMRGLTIVPAVTAKIDHLVGSLEPGKQADVLITTGHLADPRTAVDVVYIEGRRAYDAERDGRRW
jgi:imidazolonepropionase-like amidohydrolase